MVVETIFFPTNTATAKVIKIKKQIGNHSRNVKTDKTIIPNKAITPSDFTNKENAKTTAIVTKTEIINPAVNVGTFKKSAKTSGTSVKLTNLTHQCYIIPVSYTHLTLPTILLV